jgi:predicted RNA binding protein YcfA (HicA-like mRNA interferase family)
MKSVSGKSLCKIVEQRRWILKRVNGSHHIYQSADNVEIISIPVHGNRDLKVGTLRSLMKVIGLTESDLI